MSTAEAKGNGNPSPGWTSVDNLSAGVPVAAKVNADQMPTAVWKAKVASVAARVVVNGMLTAKDVGIAASHPLLIQVDEFEKRLEATILRERITGSAPDVIGEEPLTMTTLPEKVDTYEDITKEIDTFVYQLRTGSLASVGLKEKVQRPSAKIGQPSTLQNYKDLFKVIPLPEVANDFQTDECFAKYRIAGPNPMLLKGITAVELFNLVGNRIPDDALNAILGTQGDTIVKAGSSGRLCVTDFKALSGVDPVVVVGKSFVTDPIAVFVEPVTANAHIHPVAIQLGQDPEHSELILANTNDHHRWQMAKSIVQVADATCHELVEHLAHTHLVSEAFSIATQHNMDQIHPIRRLLSPHFDGTNFINHSAATALIADNGWIDAVWANDRMPRLRSLQALAVNSRFSFDFQKRMPDAELRSRNVLSLKLYPYRDDVMLLWDSILHWSQAYVDLYYADDAAVIGDEQLMAWSKDIKENADVRGFEAPKTKAVLVRTLAMIMFVASAQHAAVNFPQQTMMIFAPAMTGAIWDDLPPSDRPATEEEWLKMLPSMDTAKEQLGLLYLLGGVYYRRLGQYHSNTFPYWGTLESKAKDALKNFKNELDAVESVIKARNINRGNFTYEYLLPSNIPASINI